MLSPRLVLDVLARPRRERYGAHRSQVADLHLPGGPGPHPVVVLVHGGTWSERWSKVIMRPLAGALARAGWAAWNIEYRRLGGGGGWPQTFLDVAAATDLLAELDAPLDLSQLTVVGHSAGGHLALWIASRHRLPAGAPGAEPRVRPGAAVSQAGVADLSGAAAGSPAVRELMGGTPESVPERYAIGDPMRLLPLGVPVLLVHGVADDLVTIRRSRDYERAARAAGDPVTLVEIEGTAGRHRNHLLPDGRSWAAVREWLASDRPAAIR